MYVERIQLANYGPIVELDIFFPFEGESPKPILLVGENGSGKSIVLSHIVNGLLSAQHLLFPDTPEVEIGRVYKLRSNSYIRSGEEFYFSRVDFESDLHIGELRSRQAKNKYEEGPRGLSGTNGLALWKDMKLEDNDRFTTCLDSRNTEKIRRVYLRRCVLYFPPNRFEEPAWLNKDNLEAKARFTDADVAVGSTDRKVVNYSPLHKIKDWLFGVVYDRVALEIQTPNFQFPANDGRKQMVLPIFAGYSGDATNTYNAALSVVRAILREPSARFGIGNRRNRVISVESNAGQVVPNVFQMSSGETSLLNLFLSILRDYELSGGVFGRTEDIRGIVVVDEIDLHLHTVHQYEILPSLITMFPKVQFVITTHSPLFVLGMHEILGDSGVGLYQLPRGQEISHEEFSEFGSAYTYFAETGQFSEDIRKAVESSQRPLVIVEGKTDIKYIQKAAELLDLQGFLAEIQLLDGNGFGGLDKIYRHYNSKLSEVAPQKIILCYDCDKPNSDSKGMVYKRSLPKQEDHPLEKGIENLFSKVTLQNARDYKDAFIDVTSAHSKTEGGECLTVPEEWTINRNEKANLCSWLCENGTVEDFQHFRVVFDLLEEVLGLGSPKKARQAPGSSNSLPST
ncbi:MAG: ATP-binding protein [Caldilineaceae bacterium]|nr:ATP-binding protein [Caldilineaceae bacterium]